MALSVLMKVPEGRKAWLRARALQRIMGSALTQSRKAQLGEIVEAYMKLHEPHLSEYDRLLQTEDFKMALVLGETSVEKGERAAVRKLLESWFAPLSPAARQRFEGLSPKQVEELGFRLREAKSLAELGLEDSPAPTP